MINFQNPKLNRHLQSTLRSGEKVLWTHEDASAPWSHRALLAYGLVFTMIWLGFVLNISGGWNLPNGSEAVFIALPFIFLAVGFGQLAVLIWSIYRMNKFAYVVTDQRVILTNSVSPMLTKVVGAKDVTSLQRSGDEDRGTIKLKEPDFSFFANSLNFFTPLKLANIPNPKQVEALIYDHLVKPLSRKPNQ